MACVFGFSGECWGSMAELTNCTCSGLSCIFSMVSARSLVGIYDSVMETPRFCPTFSRNSKKTGPAEGLI